MATTSRIPAVIDYLVTTCTADATLAALTFDDAVGVRVFDGTPPTAEYPKLALYLAVDDPDSDSQTAADGEQEWAALGALARDEQITVWCAAEAWYGDSSSVAAARTAAFGIVAAVETILRADGSLGGIVLFGAPGITGHRLQQAWGESGVRVRVAFRIDMKVRLR